MKWNPASLDWLIEFKLAENLSYSNALQDQTLVFPHKIRAQQDHKGDGFFGFIYRNSKPQQQAQASAVHTHRSWWSSYCIDRRVVCWWLNVSWNNNSGHGGASFVVEDNHFQLASWAPSRRIKIKSKVVTSRQSIFQGHSRTYENDGTRHGTCKPLLKAAEVCSAFVLLDKLSLGILVEQIFRGKTSWAQDSRWPQWAATVPLGWGSRIRSSSYSRQPGMLFSELSDGQILWQTQVLFKNRWRDYRRWEKRNYNEIHAVKGLVRCCEESNNAQNTTCSNGSSISQYQRTL